MYAQIHSYVYLHIYIYIHICIHIYFLTYIIYIYMYIYIHIFIHMYVNICTHIYMYIHTYTYVHTYICKGTSHSTTLIQPLLIESNNPTQPLLKLKSSLSFLSVSTLTVINICYMCCCSASTIVHCVSLFQYSPPSTCM